MDSVSNPKNIVRRFVLAAMRIIPTVAKRMIAKHSGYSRYRLSCGFMASKIESPAPMRKTKLKVREKSSTETSPPNADWFSPISADDRIIAMKRPESAMPRETHRLSCGAKRLTPTIAKPVSVKVMAGEISHRLTEENASFILYYQPARLCFLAKFSSSLSMPKNLATD